MTSRREFLKVGLATTVPLALPMAGEARSGEPDALPLYRVLYERGLPISVAFGRHAARQGIVTQAIDGDITQFWYDDLYHRWRDGSVAVAGLTTYGALFCLEQLAWDHRLRVVFRGRHTSHADGVRHALEGSPALLRRAQVTLGRPRWAASMADIVVRCPGRADVATVADVTTPATESAGLPPEGLFSWVIAAPVVRASWS